jgi:hypothetical protein
MDKVLPFLDGFTNRTVCLAQVGHRTSTPPVALWTAALLEGRAVGRCYMEECCSVFCLRRAGETRLSSGLRLSLPPP